MIDFRSVAYEESFKDEEIFKGNEILPITKFREGLLAPNTTPYNQNAKNNKQQIKQQIEQYSIKFGCHANQLLNSLARDTLFFGDAVTNVGGYLGGNTRVISALTANSTNLLVDDIRGFQHIVSNKINSIVTVSRENTIIVSVNGKDYKLIGVNTDSSNKSTAPQGVSGTLIFDNDVAIADGALNSPVVVSTAPRIIRPNKRLTTAHLTATDTFNFHDVIYASTQLRSNGVEAVKDNCYYCYLSYLQMKALRKDPSFQNLYQDNDNDQIDKIFTLWGPNLKFIETTEAIQQNLNGLEIQRAIVVGKGALVKGKVEQNETLTGFGLLIDITDITTMLDIIPTASNAYLKRAVVIESA